VAAWRGRPDRDVGRADRDLVAALRAEIAAIDPGRACDRAAEQAGLSEARAGRRAAVARLAVRLRRAGVRDDRSTAFDWQAAADHCRIAWLRGRFLAVGSLSVAGGRTHLEFVVDPDEAALLASRLGAIGLPASWRLRRGRGVVTWKGAETVGTFLRLIGAGATLLELEARAVARALRGELNRVLNAESANLERAVSAAGRQVAAIDAIEADGRLSSQPYIVRLVADARRETPEATLSELADRLGLHRSAVQRALERVERLALHDDQEAGRRSSRTGARTDRRSRRTRDGQRPEGDPALA
jgi:WhiA-like protein/LAGLIDADG DNA endonuclease family protein